MKAGKKTGFGPAITFTENGRSQNEISATVVHEALHAYKSNPYDVHPFRQSGYQFKVGEIDVDFDVVARDEKQWTNYILDQDMYD